MNPTPENTHYRDKRVADMTRKELMDAVIDLTRRAQDMHAQHGRNWDKLRKLQRGRV